MAAEQLVKIGLPEKAAKKPGAGDQLGKTSVQLMRRVVFGSAKTAQPTPELEFIRRMQLMNDERVWTVLPYRLDVR